MQSFQGSVTSAEGALFAEFAALCEKLAATTRKLEKRALIAEWLCSVTPTDAGRGALYLAGIPFAETDTRKLNVGGALLSRALGDLSGAEPLAMHAAYLRHGDLGGAARDLLENRVPDQETARVKPLQLADVAKSFDQIAAVSRPAPKLALTLSLLARATPLEAKYLIKIMLGDMRTGVKQSLVEEGIAAAYEVKAGEVRRASMLHGSLPEVVQMAAAGRLGEARMKLFHPLGFMLASPVDSVQEAIARFAQEVATERVGTPDVSEGLPSDPSAAEAGTPPAPDVVEVATDVLKQAQMEDKYDGIRAQLHAGDPEQAGRVALFSRSREDMTVSFPEIADAFSRLNRPVILDGEVLAWDPKLDRALPFSSLQQRVGRKRITEEMKKQTPVVFMGFDLLYFDGDLLLEAPLRARREALQDFVERERAGLLSGSTGSGQARAGQAGLFPNEAATVAESGEEVPRLVLAPAVRLHSAEQLDQAYSDARARGNEGVMLKALGSIYQPGRRGLAWLKLKRELATLDVVVTAVEYGHGRRAKVLSDYTFAVRDGGELKNVGKAYSGLTDSEINEYTAFFLEHTLEDYGRVRSVEPLLVLEVAFNNLMRSERHASGFALRFPRIVRIRTDKLPAEIDTLARVEEIYNSQPDRPVE
ncbi:MAG TPA: ATP-dependent DNA ligase [Acidisarcina sp.]